MVHYCCRSFFLSSSIFHPLPLLGRFTKLSFHCGCCLALFHRALQWIIVYRYSCISGWHLQSRALGLIAFCLFQLFLHGSYYVLIGSLLLVVVSVVFLSLLCTSMSLMFLFRLYAIIGISGHKILSFGSFSIMFQCHLRICPMWVVFVLYSTNQNVDVIVVGVARVKIRKLQAS